MKYFAEFTMEPAGIGQCLEFIEESLHKFYLKKQDVMESILISEEVLLELKKSSTEGACVQVSVYSRLGVPKIRLVVPGTYMTMGEHISNISLEQYNDKTEDEIRSILLNSYADSIKYHYSKGNNIITIVTGIPERILANQTIIALGLSLVSGVLLRCILPEYVSQWMVDYIIYPVDVLFISALSCIAAPAIFVSLTCSIFRFEGYSELEGVRKRVILSYLFSSAGAICIGLLSFQLIQPGIAGSVAEDLIIGGRDNILGLSIIQNIIPPNIIEPFMSVNSLQLMVMAITIGSAMVACGKKVKHLKVLLEEVDDLCAKLASMAIRMMPVVAYCATLNIILTSRGAIFISILQLLLTLCIGFVLMMAAYCVGLLVLARLNPLVFLKKYLPVMKSIFLKSSEIASIPLTMRACKTKFGIRQNIYEFSIPFGATINMDGNCICLTIITFYLARICGITLDFNSMLLILFLVYILSIGAPIAPGTIILCLVTILTQMGVDTKILSMIIGINFLLEMMLAMMNSVGDVVMTLIIARKEKALDLEVYYK